MIVTVTLNTAIDHIVEVENFRAGTLNKGSLREFVPAGKGVNVSRVLAQLGVESVVTGFVGAREAPLYAQALDCKAVSRRLVQVAGRTRTNTTVVDPASSRETHIRERGFQVTAPEKDKLIDAVSRASSPGDIVAVCGSFPPGWTSDDLGRLIDAVGERAARVLLDVSEGGVEAGRRHRVWTVKGNEEELGDGLGRKISDISQLAALARELARDVGIVVGSAGAQGAVVAADGRALCAACPAPASSVRNTVGAGDASLAGFLAGWIEGEDLELGLRLAVAAGASKVMHVATSEIDPEFVRRTAKEIEVREV